MKINIFLPGVALDPIGGYKIMYEYANKFAEEGHDVVIYDVYTNPHTKYKYPHWLRMIKNRIRFSNYGPTWFPLNKRITYKGIPRLKDKYIRDADVSLATSWILIPDLSDLSESKGKKINLIQGYEVWMGNNKKMLHATYRLPITHIAIADYLADIVETESGVRPPIVYNGIHQDIFKITTPIEQRNPHTVSMLFSTNSEIKGTQYGIEALRICKKEIPDLKVELFGVYLQPEDLEDWIHYTQKPQDLCALYNSTAIYFSPSNTEGWALPPAEAMNCGCTLVCTNIGGHSVYAKNNETALLVEPKNSQDMAEKLLILLKDNERRITLAKSGNEFIKQFNWENAVNKLEQLFY